VQSSYSSLFLPHYFYEVEVLTFGKLNDDDDDDDDEVCSLLFGTTMV